MSTSATALLASDAQLKETGTKAATFNTVASNEAVDRTAKALADKQHKVTVVETAAAALEAIKTAIPKGASVHNAGSTTLGEIGFVDYLKTQTEWRNIHGEILAEKDQAKSGELRRTAGTTADYFLSSVSAVSEQGDLVLVDATGTRVGPISGAGNVILVVSANKIAADYDAAVRRTYDWALPLESARARIAYGAPGSAINNFLAVRGSNPWGGAGRIHVILIKGAALGY